MGYKQFDIEIGSLACLLSSTLLWNIDEKQHGGLDVLKETFFFLPDLKRDFDCIKSAYSGSVKLIGPAIQTIAHDCDTALVFAGARGVALGANNQHLENHLEEQSATATAFKHFFPQQRYFRKPKEGTRLIGKHTCEKHFKELENLILEEPPMPKKIWGIDITAKSFAEIV